MNEILKVKNLSFSYSKKTMVLNDIFMSVKKNERVGILGPNGSGKTTLVRILSGVLRNYQGNITIEDKDLKKYSYKELSRIVAVVPQSFAISLDYKVEDIILMGRYPYSSMIKGFGKKDYEVLEKIIEMMDLKEIRYKNFNKISGGEAQRVVVAKALAQSPKILILDEFAAHLDLNHKRNLINIINSIKDITLIGVYHDINLCTEMVNKIYFIKNGMILFNGLVNDMINEKIINKVYGVDVKIIRDDMGKKKIFI